MSYKELKDCANLFFDKEKQGVQVFLDKCCKKFEENKFKLEYRFYSKKNSKKPDKIDLELVCEIYPLNYDKNKSIKAYEYRSYKFVLCSYTATNQNKFFVPKRSKQLLKMVLKCQLLLLSNSSLIKENIFDFIFKIFCKKNTFRFPNEFRGKNIELIRFIIIDVLPLLFASALIIAFVIKNPGSSFWSLI